MAQFRPDLRRIWRAIATRAQDENLDRLLTAQAVKGGEVAPQRPHDAPAQTGRRKRIRLLGVRVAVAELAGKLGVRTGELAKDLVRRANIKVRRTGFTIVPGPEIALRWRAFLKGSRHQAARPVGGLSAALVDDAAAQVAAEARDQLAAHMQAELVAARSGGD